MMHASEVLVHILRGAWGAIMGLMVAVALLAMLAQLVKLAGGASLGAAMITARAAGSMLALIVVVLYAFLAIPAIVQAVSSSKAAGGCGPAAGLGQAAAYAMAAITALRMARAAFVSMFSALSGASEGISYAIGEAAESVVGMLLISIAVPVAAALLGAC